METLFGDWELVPLRGSHGSYLQGMETDLGILCGIFLTGRTDPTYKEWKLETPSQLAAACIVHGSYLQGMETYGRNGHRT